MGKKLEHGQTLGNYGGTAETNVCFVSRASVASYSTYTTTDVFSDSVSTSNFSCAFDDFSDTESNWSDKE